MRPILRLALILLVVLTGIGLGAARGTVQSGGQLVLCSGQGIAVVPGEGGRAHICPDMALALLNATPPAAPDILPPDSFRRAAPAIPAGTGRSALRPAATARDPPSAISAI